MDLYSSRSLYLAILITAFTRLLRIVTAPMHFGVCQQTIIDSLNVSAAKSEQFHSSLAFSKTSPKAKMIQT